MTIEMVFEKIAQLWIFVLLPFCLFGFIRYVFLKQILQGIRGKDRDSDLR